MTQPSERAGPDPPTTTGGEANRRVLVVDDERAVRAVAEECLQLMGFATTGCGDRVEAIAELERDPKSVRFVLIDLMMPKLNGRETLDRLLAIDPDVTAIVCSGYPAEDAPGGDLPRGAAGYLAKPYRLDDLVRVVEQVLT